MKTEHIKVTIEVYFDNTDNLVIEGYDIGKTVEEYWGDNDYEYSTTIQPEEVKKLYVALNLTPDSKDDLLNYFRVHYNKNDCYSKIQNLLDYHQIKYEGFSWR